MKNFGRKTALQNAGSVKIAQIVKILKQNGNLFYLFSGQLISQMGDSIYQIGLMWLVLELTGSKSAMGIVAMVSYLPMLIFGLFGGVLVDIFDRRKVMIISDIARALVVIIIPFTFFSGIISLPVILTVSFGLALFSTLFNPARDSFLPDLVKKENLLKANSLLQGTSYAAILIGPAIGAALISIVGIAHLFTIDAFTFVISFTAIILIKKKSLMPEPAGLSSFAGKIFEIIKYINKDKRLRFLIGLTAANNFFIMGPAIVGTPIFVKDILGGNAAEYALTESALGLGMIVGAVLINYANKKIGKGKILLIGLMFDGITLALVMFTRSVDLFMLLIAFHAIGIPMIVVSRTALIQEWIDSLKLGRVFSVVNIAVVGVTALTTGFTGFLAEYVSIDVIFGIFGLGAFFSGIAGWAYRDLRCS